MPHATTRWLNGSKQSLLGIKSSAPNALAILPSTKKLKTFNKQLTDCNEKTAEFIPSIWTAMVDKVTVNANSVLLFNFKSGTVL